MESIGIGVIIFVVIWGYALFKWGFLKGLAIGWIPAGIGGLIAIVVSGIFFH
jgi:hypothetical protein